MSEIIKVIMSTSFIPIIFRILHWYIRQKSDNKQFSKYYLKLNKTQESIDVKFLNEKCDMIVFFVIKLLVVITTTVILTYAFSENESFISYCYSMNSLRLVKHILDITIAVTFSLIGLLTLFLSLNKYNKYIINLYNVVAIFKCILSTKDSEIITECYKSIIKNNNIDSYLYFLVSYFLYEYDKHQFEKYKKDSGCYLHKNCGSNWKQEEPFIKNLVSILYDITRDEKICIKVNEFLKFYQS